MKNLKSLLSAVALLFICVAANATVKPATAKPTKDDVVNIYIDAISHAKPAALTNLLSDDMQFNIQRGENVKTLSRDDFMTYLKNGSSETPVSTTSTIQQEDDSNYVIKIDFKYADFTRSDVVTLQNTNGWTVTHVVSSFK